uniref:Uncharacterized protein n=1 Tax=Plectus sambesii TaxID=2011161 RepID=A0A914W264_9BILA
MRWTLAERVQSDLVFASRSRATNVDPGKRHAIDSSLFVTHITVAVGVGRMNTARCANVPTCITGRSAPSGSTSRLQDGQGAGVTGRVGALGGQTPPRSHPALTVARRAGPVSCVRAPLTLTH